MVALVAAGVAVYIFRDEIWSAFKAIYEAVVGTLGKVVDWLSGNWNTVATLISGPFMPLVALATDAFGIRSALVGAFEGIVGAIGGFAESAFKGF